jgi:predicted AlkP superfamily phosphohydrolase/phosphomutase
MRNEVEQMAESGNDKVLVFGIDGACWEILQPLMDSGQTPALARIAKEGVSGVLASTIHPHSPTAWASFITGANPGTHGIFDFVRRKPGTYDIEILTTRERGGKAVWQALSEKGVSCGVVNVPMTHPPEKVAGFFISGTFTANTFANFTYPRTLLEEMKTALGRPYRVDVYLADFAKGQSDPNAEVRGLFLDDLLKLEEERTDATLYLLDRFKPRFLVHVVTSTDRAQHMFWQYIDPTRPGYDPRHPYHDAIAKTYIDADRQLARLWKAMGEDATVIVLSDHGGAPLHRALLLNEWLESEGLLATTRPSPYSARGLLRNVLRTGYLAARRVLPTNMKRQISGRFDVWGKSSSKFMRQWEIDWARTKAFAEGTFGNIRLNVRGQEPLGTVEPGNEYEAVRQEIRRKIEALVDPATGAPAVQRTFSREELYHGERLAAAPDIVVELKPGYQMVGDIVARRYGNKKQRAAGLFVDATGEGNKLQVSGIHSPDGILLARGTGIARGARIEGAHITDLAPTVLRIFGVPIPPVMDGRVLPEIAPEPVGAGARREGSASQARHTPPAN